MADPNQQQQTPVDEDSIQVVARFRPLNDSEEKAGSKFVVSFPPSNAKGKEDTLVSIGVSIESNIHVKHILYINYYFL